MKKGFHLLCSLIIIVVVFFSGVLSVGVSAQETAQTYNVGVQIYVLEDAKIAKYKEIDFYLMNVETGEELKFDLTAGKMDRVNIKVPKGEYVLTRANIADNPGVAFEVSNSGVSVDGVSDGYFLTFSLRSVLSDEQDEEFNEGMEKLRQEEEKEKNNILLAFGLMLWLCLGIVSLIYTLRANHTKKYYKVSLLEAKARITRHIFFSLISGFFLGYIFGDGSFSWIFAIVGLGFPFGVSAVGMFFAHGEKDYYDYERDRESSAAGIQVVLMVVLGLAIGAIALPFILIRDIVKLVKGYIEYREGRKNKNSV